jgi:hypothetical protein
MTGARILVVDDEELIRWSLARKGTPSKRREPAKRLH